MAWLSNLVVVSVWLTPMFLVFNTGAQDISTASCTEYVTEGGTLDCTCVGLCQGDDTVTPTWPGHADTTNRLVMTNIRRQRDGEQFECRMECDGQTYTTIYNLQVAYGPGETDTKVVGPSPFITFNGTQTMTLTCNATVNPTPDYLWIGISCENGNTDSTCIYTPNITEDGTLVQCVVTNRKFNPPKLVKSDSYGIIISYPPQSSPRISAYKTDQTVKAGDTLTCTVSGGKPLVANVIFICTNPVHVDREDTVNQTAVSSTITIDPSGATSGEMLCNCRATWDPKLDLYTHETQASFPIEYPPSIVEFNVNGEYEHVTLGGGNEKAVTIECQARGIPPPKMFLVQRRDDDLKVLVGQETNNENGTMLKYVFPELDCRDMGIYTCFADNGIVPQDKTALLLGVPCSPRLASKSFSNTRQNRSELTKEGLSFSVIAHPAPASFSYFNYASEDRNSNLAASDMFETKCAANETSSPLVTCTLIAVDVSQLGVYSVELSNGLGSMEYFFEVKAPVGRVAKSTNGINMPAIAGGVVGGIVVLGVAIVVAVFVLKRIRNRKNENPRPRRSQNSHLYMDIQQQGTGQQSSINLNYANSQELSTQLQSSVNYANTEPRPDLSQTSDLSSYENVETRNAYERVDARPEAAPNVYNALYTREENAGVDNES